MKLLRIVLLVFLSIFASCSSDNETPAVNELEGLSKFKEITNATHTIELYKQMGTLEQGYNEIALRIKDNSSNEYIKNATINWMPVMHMTSMNHSCPKSTVSKVTADGTLYEGYIIFQMAQNATEYWDLKIDLKFEILNWKLRSILLPKSSHPIRIRFHPMQCHRHCVTRNS